MFAFLSGNDLECAIGSPEAAAPSMLVTPLPGQAASPPPIVPVGPSAPPGAKSHHQRHQRVCNCYCGCKKRVNRLAFTRCDNCVNNCRAS
ncbi:hypothetical protein G6O67_004869 [Ophiocordyceps sinensis]|uniref:Uncharacterized protein n=1 Tax=Ophiocordyceps sinensis TaxID=72228 RepID=A0A8H4V592_9HYPO|nr:hypothetical protein G6O67_004869 [Ophiocordyceps sinensis]